MTRFLASQLGKSHYFSIERAKRDFGYEPQISTEEGMQRLATAAETGQTARAAPTEGNRS